MGGTGRIPFIAGNWKMFKTVAEATAFVTDLALLENRFEFQKWLRPR